MQQRQQSRGTSEQLQQEPKTRRNHFQSKRNIVKTSSSLLSVAFNSIWTISLAVHSQPIALCRLNDSEKKNKRKKIVVVYRFGWERLVYVFQFGRCCKLVLLFIIWWNECCRGSESTTIAGHMSMQYETQLCAISSVNGFVLFGEYQHRTERASGVRSESEMKRPITMWR